ncbi:coiled-coil-helix-coiled-coil-helix domain-containing protein 2-like [Cimex lectularius]|uniref:CHCH domain-containing protein n=1 Tax=Cimex lectularius TaxID=79782 RepID=A0A8I6THZ1_CIMLE|nr:coiled-coil-helix-coiled-coil-helix domain-containing protein 2-like [Cimex lectularius]XP_014262103.1 coiled-coil-helix-coiled-coil-helix domain-containing protein 2-like [Cimex lectularius]
MSRNKGSAGGRSHSAGSAKHSSTHAPAQKRAPPPPPPPPPPPKVIRERTVIIQDGGRRPGLFGQMAATAAGVAVGSSVGHAVGEAMTGGSHKDPPQQQQQQQEPPGPCSNEIEQFIKCTQNNDDIGLCQGFNEAIKECKKRNGLK